MQSKNVKTKTIGRFFAIYCETESIEWIIYSFRMLSHNREIAKNKKSKGSARKIFKVTEKYSCPLLFLS